MLSLNKCVQIFALVRPLETVRIQVSECTVQAATSVLFRPVARASLPNSQCFCDALHVVGHVYVDRTVLSCAGHHRTAHVIARCLRQAFSVQTADRQSYSEHTCPCATRCIGSLSV